MGGEDFEVHVYAEQWEEEVQDIHFHRVQTVPFPKSARLLSFAVRATQEMVNENYDVTLGVGNTLRADVLQPHGGVHWAWFWRSLRAYDHPFLWVIKFLGRVLSPKQWIQGYIENAPYKKNDFYRIVAISDMVKQDVMHWYGIPEDRIAVVYNGVDTERFHPRNRQHREEIRRRHGIGDEFVILFVSNNFRMKGLVYLIKALAEIK
jgi:UDP-glucose:(heptosyl)LPS alpha-1,3-glucosyltransferase